MGKKKVIKQTEEALLKESDTRKVPQPRPSAEERGQVSTLPKMSKQMAHGRVYVQATYNNTIVSVTDESGNVVAWASSGNLGFKGPKKATPYAASRVSETVVEKVKKTGIINVEVFVKGIGSGRESAVRSLAAHGLNILSIKDVTPIPHNGPRPRKVRRV